SSRPRPLRAIHIGEEGHLERGRGDCLRRHAAQFDFSTQAWGLLTGPQFPRPSRVLVHICSNSCNNSVTNHTLSSAEVTPWMIRKQQPWLGNKGLSALSAARVSRWRPQRD